MAYRAQSHARIMLRSTTVRADLDEHSYERRGCNLRYRPRCSACHYVTETSRLLRYSGLAPKIWPELLRLLTLVLRLMLKG